MEPYVSYSNLVKKKTKHKKTQKTYYYPCILEDEFEAERQFVTCSDSSTFAEGYRNIWF